MSDDFDDLFDDDDFGDFDSFDDEPAASLQDEDDLFGGDDFTDFGDDELDSFDDFDEDDFDSFDDLDEDFLVEDEAAGERSGPNRTFVLLAGMMIFLFLIGLILVVFLATREEGPDSIDLTTTAVVAINATRMVEQDLTLTQSAEDADSTATQQAVDMEATSIAAENMTMEAEQAMTQAVLDEQANATATAEAEEELIAQQTMDAQATFDSQTLTAAPDEPVGTPETLEPSTPVGIGDVQQTATAIAAALLNSPTPDEGGGTPIGGAATQPPSQLPDSGLFDNATGGTSMGAIALIAFGLIGIIFGARRLRVVNSKED